MSVTSECWAGGTEGAPGRAVAGNPSTLTSRNNLALAYQDAGRTAEVIPLLEQPLADSERLLGADHSTTNVMRRNLAALASKPMSGNGQ